jgi:hypothetical protein
VAGFRGNRDRWPAFIIAQRGVSPMSQQEVAQVGMPQVRRALQGREAAMLARVDLRPMCQKMRDQWQVLLGALICHYRMERQVLHGVARARADIRSVCQQRLDGGCVADKGCQVEWGPSAIAVFVDEGAVSSEQHNHLGRVARLRRAHALLPLYRAATRCWARAWGRFGAPSMCDCDDYAARACPATAVAP